MSEKAVLVESERDAAWRGFVLGVAVSTIIWILLIAAYQLGKAS